jgi:hypothetical protein
VNELRLTHVPAAAGSPAKVRVHARPAQGPGSEKEIEFAFSLSEGERDELRRYYEEYPAWPPDPLLFSAAADRVKEVGERLFRAVFGRAETAGLATWLLADPPQWHLVVEAAGIEGAAIPWELLRASAGGRPIELACELAGFFRGGPGPAPLPPGPPAGGPVPLRVLLITCRPDGDRDVPFQWVSGVLQRICHGSGGRARLDVLRPPTFARLEEALSRHRGYYHVVHFDGHGAFLEGAPRPRAACSSSRRGKGVGGAPSAGTSWAGSWPPGASRWPF